MAAIGTHHCKTDLSSQNVQRQVATSQRAGGARRDRTDDLKLAKLALSQLSYGPVPSGHTVIAKQVGLNLVGLSGLEPLTSRLSGVCSNHLSYRPSEEQTAQGRQSLVTGQLSGIPIGLNLPNILRKKEKRSRRWARRTSTRHERQTWRSRSCRSFCSNIEP